ncbi:sterol carrier protein domain-containing protein [Streptomyces sp. x-80]
MDELAQLLLGDASVVRLARLGRIPGLWPGAAALVDLLFWTPLRRWCPG